MNKKKLKQQRYLFFFCEKKKKIFKSIFFNENFTNKLRYKTLININNFSKHTSTTYIKNICLLSKKCRSTFKLYKLSRQEILKNYNNLHLKKFSW